MTIDVTIVWTAVIAFAVFMYVLLDGFDLGAQMAQRRRLDDVPLPQRQRGRHGAAGGKVGRAVADVERTAGAEAHRIVVPAPSLRIARRQCGEAHARPLEQGPALVRLASERGELAPGERPHRLREVERRPRQVLWMIARPAPGEHREEADQRQREQNLEEADEHRIGKRQGRGGCTQVRRAVSSSSSVTG